MNFDREGKIERREPGKSGAESLERSKPIQPDQNRMRLGGQPRDCGVAQRALSADAIETNVLRVIREERESQPKVARRVAVETASNPTESNL